jgi:hypothetical protein
MSTPMRRRRWASLSTVEVGTSGMKPAVRETVKSEVGADWNAVLAVTVGIARARSDSSPKLSSRRRTSPARSAANSGDGSRPTTRSQAAGGGIRAGEIPFVQDPAATTLLAAPPLPLGVGLPVGVTNRSRQESSRSASRGKRPRAVPARKLSKALRAASSSSASTPTRVPGPVVEFPLGGGINAVDATRPRRMRDREWIKKWAAMACRRVPSSSDLWEGFAPFRQVW